MQDRASAITANYMLLLPWHVTGRLPPDRARRIDALLAHSGELARQSAFVSRERAATIAANESLGQPSPRALLALFAAIDSDPSDRKISTRHL